MRQMSFDKWIDGLEEQLEAEFAELIAKGELDADTDYNQFLTDKYESAYDTYCDQVYQEMKDDRMEEENDRNR